MKQLVEENTTLVDYMNQTEKDTMDVISYLKKLDVDKDDEVIAWIVKPMNDQDDVTKICKLRSSVWSMSLKIWEKFTKPKKYQW